MNEVKWIVIEHGCQAPLYTEFSSKDEAEKYIDKLEEVFPYILIRGEIVKTK